MDKTAHIVTKARMDKAYRAYAKSPSATNWRALEAAMLAHQEAMLAKGDMA